MTKLRNWMTGEPATDSADMAEPATTAPGEPAPAAAEPPANTPLHPDSTPPVDAWAHALRPEMLPPLNAYRIGFDWRCRGCIEKAEQYLANGLDQDMPAPGGGTARMSDLVTSAREHWDQTE